MVSQVRPLSARSVVLSLLLGAHPPELSARELVAVGELFDINEATLRVALTRMVAAGDLDRADATYRLSARMRQRQERQDLALETAVVDWSGAWELVVITSTGRSATARADLRNELAALKLAELREGVWTRPANLGRRLPDWPGDLISTFTSTPAEDPRTLAGTLWDLDRWSRESLALLGNLGTASTAAERLAVAAAVVRQLRTDPALPPGLLPERWPAGDLQRAYTAYQEQLIDLGLKLSV